MVPNRLKGLDSEIGAKPLLGMPKTGTPLVAFPLTTPDQAWSEFSSSVLILVAACLGSLPGWFNVCELCLFLELDSVSLVWFFLSDFLADSKC